MRPDPPIARDVFSTAAERAVHGGARYMTPLEKQNFFTAADRWQAPRLIAYQGFDPRPFHDLPVYYLDAASGNYVDTLSGEVWEST